MPGPIGLRPVTEADGFLIRRWLREAQLRAGLGNRASAEAEIALARLSGAALCRILTAERVPIGYAQAVEVGLVAGLKPPELLPGTWELQFMLATPGRPEVLAAIPAMLAAEVFATTLAVACSGLISIKAETVARAYERAGFRWRRIWTDPLLGPAWLMLKERPR